MLEFISGGVSDLGESGAMSSVRGALAANNAPRNDLHSQQSKKAADRSQVSDQPSTRFSAAICQNRCPLDSGRHLFWRSGSKSVDAGNAAMCRGWALLRPAHPAAPAAPTGAAAAPRSGSSAVSAVASEHRSGMPADRAR